ncbi:hypothetical protein EIP91_012338 [Steccherinum ochraceum]|uniref:Uncharacterized protein n=1 Tax=Steccherinum ochraceum TaxID=92696 RepID=A0A4V6N774_9APHY|nr:hypothetical protein EIP91_012338 [Steccherinum ochraceum]
MTAHLGEVEILDPEWAITALLKTPLRLFYSSEESKEKQASCSWGQKTQSLETWEAQTLVLGFLLAKKMIRINYARETRISETIGSPEDDLATDVVNACEDRDLCRGNKIIQQTSAYQLRMPSAYQTTPHAISWQGVRVAQTNASSGLTRLPEDAPWIGRKCCLCESESESCAALEHDFSSQKTLARKEVLSLSSSRRQVYT